eukprot:jgi/Bigna1/90445/estExt_fgenesh1_pg.C_700103
MAVASPPPRSPSVTSRRGGEMRSEVQNLRIDGKSILKRANNRMKQRKKQLAKSVTPDDENWGGDSATDERGITPQKEHSSTSLIGKFISRFRSGPPVSREGRDRIGPVWWKNEHEHLQRDSVGREHFQGTEASDEVDEEGEDGILPGLRASSSTTSSIATPRPSRYYPSSPMLYSDDDENSSSSGDSEMYFSAHRTSTRSPRKRADHRHHVRHRDDDAEEEGGNNSDDGKKICIKTDHGGDRYHQGDKHSPQPNRSSFSSSSGLGGYSRVADMAKQDPDTVALDEKARVILQQAKRVLEQEIHGDGDGDGDGGGGGDDDDDPFAKLLKNGEEGELGRGGGGSSALLLPSISSKRQANVLRLLRELKEEGAVSGPSNIPEEVFEMKMMKKKRSEESEEEDEDFESFDLLLEGESSSGKHRDPVDDLLAAWRREREKRRLGSLAAQIQHMPPPPTPVAVNSIFSSELSGDRRASSSSPLQLSVSEDDDDDAETLERGRGRRPTVRPGAVAHHRHGGEHEEGHEDDEEVDWEIIRSSRNGSPDRISGISGNEDDQEALFGLKPIRPPVRLSFPAVSPEQHRQQLSKEDVAAAAAAAESMGGGKYSRASLANTTVTTTSTERRNDISSQEMGESGLLAFDSIATSPSSSLSSSSRIPCSPMNSTSNDKNRAQKEEAEEVKEEGKETKKRAYNRAAPWSIASSSSSSHERDGGGGGGGTSFLSTSTVRPLPVPRSVGNGEGEEERKEEVVAKDRSDDGEERKLGEEGGHREPRLPRNHDGEGGGEDVTKTCKQPATKIRQKKAEEQKESVVSPSAPLTPRLDRISPLTSLATVKEGGGNENEIVEEKASEKCEGPRVTEEPDMARPMSRLFERAEILRRRRRIRVTKATEHAPLTPEAAPCAETKKNDDFSLLGQIVQAARGKLSSGFSPRGFQEEVELPLPVPSPCKAEGGRRRRRSETLPDSRDVANAIRVDEKPMSEMERCRNMLKNLVHLDRQMRRKGGDAIRRQVRGSQRFEG